MHPRHLSLAVIVASLSVISVLTVVASAWLEDEEVPLGLPAKQFVVVDVRGQSVSLENNSGKVTLVHFTQLETPLCTECERFMHDQISQLERLVDSGMPDLEVITINIRKNPYSEEGWRMAEEWYGVNISWHWVEEFEPFPVSNLYLNYWDVKGAFSNPTLVLIDQDLTVVGVYNVYCIGKGVIDGVQSAESLLDDARMILSGDWTLPLEDSAGETAAGVGGMFLLGVVTSFSPCSLALLMAVVSFVGTAALRSDGRPEPQEDRYQTVGLKIGIAFTVGTAVVFLVFGLAISYVGRFVQMSSTFYLLSGIVLVILGINMIRPIGDLLRCGLLTLREARACKTARSGKKGSALHKMLSSLSWRSPSLAGFLLGALFSLGWVPCALSLVFPVLILLISRDISVLTGGLLMFVFGLGHGATIIPFCAATGEIRGALGNRYISLARWIQVGFACAVVLIGALFAARFFGINLW
ncbi:MAG: cytochrome c biogenesis protein [Thermoplasmata archaeon]